MPEPTPRVASGADPDLPPISGEELAAVTIGELTPLNATIPLLPYDPAWPRSYELEAAAVGAVLGDRVRRSTSTCSAPGARSRTGSWRSIA